jgi:hypothetical protein
MPMRPLCACAVVKSQTLEGSILATLATTDAASAPAGCRMNVSDALAKLQEIIDSAVDAVTPKEVDPEVRARVQKA